MQKKQIMFHIQRDSCRRSNVKYRIAFSWFICIQHRRRKITFLDQLGDCERQEIFRLEFTLYVFFYIVHKNINKYFIRFVISRITHSKILCVVNILCTFSHSYCTGRRFHTSKIFFFISKFIFMRISDTYITVIIVYIYIDICMLYEIRREKCMFLFLFFIGFDQLRTYGLINILPIIRGFCHFHSLTISSRQLCVPFTQFCHLNCGFSRGFLPTGPSFN